MNPRPPGKTAFDSGSELNARTYFVASSVRAAFSSQTGQSRISNSTRPPVDVRAAMRDIVTVCPTLRIRLSGQ